MNLTEYELVDLAINVQASSTASVAIFLTCTSGYLIVAWLVGARLTRAQVLLINMVFIFFQLMVAIAWGGRWDYYYRFMTALASIDPTFYETVSPFIVIAMGTVMLLSICGCLKFMWDIRHPKKE